MSGERAQMRADATASRNQMIVMGAAIKVAMIERKLSVRKLSALTGVNSVTLHHVTHGRWMLTDEQLVEVCRHLAIK
jgi:DNA-binding Xre family transcriptional regulator